jgi:hypothetical protein
MLCSWVFRFAEPQHRDGLDDLLLSLSNSTFHYFKLCCFVVAPRGFYTKAYSKGLQIDI